MSAGCTIRRANANDLIAISKLHALSWQTAYKDILPIEYLENNLEQERRKFWLKKWETLSSEDLILIAESRNNILGFACVIADQDGYDALLDSLHVIPEEKGKGIGSLLFQSVVEELLSRKKKNLYLWVFNENVPAHNFYKKMHGVPLDTQSCEVGGIAVLETRYVWENLKPPTPKGEG